jgi:hypothetical protein
VSPACDDVLDRTLFSRIGIGVPSGSLVFEGISVWLGEMPLARGCRSNGSFCESADFAESSAGGRLQAHNETSIAINKKRHTESVGSPSLQAVTTLCLSRRMCDRSLI